MGVGEQGLRSRFGVTGSIRGARACAMGRDRRRQKVLISKTEFSSRASGSMTSPADPVPCREWKLKWGLSLGQDHVAPNCAFLQYL
jgi:hypothetical protein